jgi:hypothetical protein
MGNGTGKDLKRRENFPKEKAGRHPADERVCGPDIDKTSKRDPAKAEKKRLIQTKEP